MTSVVTEISSILKISRMDTKNSGRKPGMMIFLVGDVVAGGEVGCGVVVAVGGVARGELSGEDTSCLCLLRSFHFLKWTRRRSSTSCWIYFNSFCRLLGRSYHRPCAWTKRSNLCNWMSTQKKKRKLF